MCRALGRIRAHVLCRILHKQLRFILQSFSNWLAEYLARPTRRPDLARLDPRILGIAEQ